MNSVEEAESLQRLMQKIRDKRAERVGELQMEAQRLVDWKEYVRTAPVASLLGSVAAGFLAVSALKQNTPNLQTTSTSPLPFQLQTQSQPRVVANSYFQWVLTMLLPVVTNAAKKHLMQSLSTAMQGSSNENKSTSKTVPERRAYSE